MSRRRTGVLTGLVLGAFLLGCETVQAPQAPQEPLAAAAYCSSDANVIGPEGGMLSAGRYTLVIPPGALSHNTFLTLEPVTCGEWPVEFGPEGQQFIYPVSLQMDASGEANPGAMSIQWWNPSTEQWEAMETTHDGTTLSSQLRHFSRYSLG